MSEAAALGDRIAIMAAGRLVALGPTVDLTQRYGTGYTLSLTLADGEAATFEAVRLRVAELAPAATLMLRDGAAATFSIPFAAVEASLPPLLEWCDAKGDGAAARVQEFGVSGPTLEEAFLSVTAASHFGLAEQALRAEGNEGWAAAGEGEGGEGGYAALAAGEAGAAAAAAPPMPRQYKALLVKNLTLLSRQRGLCLCQLFTPILILGLLLLRLEGGQLSLFSGQLLACLRQIEPGDGACLVFGLGQLLGTGQVGQLLFPKGDGRAEIAELPILLQGIADQQ
jgi:hypothetical protein